MHESPRGVGTQRPDPILGSWGGSDGDAQQVSLVDGCMASNSRAEAAWVGGLAGGLVDELAISRPASDDVIGLQVPSFSALGALIQVDPTVQRLDSRPPIALLQS